MQARIQDYQGLIRDLDGVLKRWPSAQPAPAASAVAVRSAAAPQAARATPKALMAIPVLVVAAVVAWKVFGGAAKPETATVTVSAAPVTSAAVAEPAAAPGAAPGVHAQARPGGSKAKPH